MLQFLQIFHNHFSQTVLVLHIGRQQLVVDSRRINGRLERILPAQRSHQNTDESGRNSRSTSCASHETNAITWRRYYERCHRRHGPFAWLKAIGSGFGEHKVVVVRREIVETGIVEDAGIGADATTAETVKKFENYTEFNSRPQSFALTH